MDVTQRVWLAKRLFTTLHADLRTRATLLLLLLARHSLSE